MSDDETELAASETPTFAPDAFATLDALMRIVSDRKRYGAHMRSLQEQQAAAAKASATLASERVTFDQEMATARGELATERADIEKRRLAVHAAEGSLTEREKRQAALEKLWRDYGEPSEVVNGFKDPERPALYKAQRAHGRLDDDAPAPLREDREGHAFPQDTTITHTSAARVRPRSQQVRADQ
jgi:hypothetical protein